MNEELRTALLRELFDVVDRCRAEGMAYAQGEGWKLEPTP